MKKLVIIFAVTALAGSLSSCYRQRVCATYVKADKKIEKTVENEKI